ncbi:hypothetical protein DUI87_04501 [Hirundo rustica rustica]|uniref:Uncharacterized protein n=1 Tax=Hirundo rustica rustica TaxID=333673 RepID=A0A3M0L0M3_HIRRU|nr:hypothetical protein DUI87_04501 [Hirundo rustica rustica]
MEALCSALEGEVSTFVRHMQRCQEGFNLHSLYHVLLLLPRSPLGQVESWQHLQRFAHCQPGVASSYVDWLASYLQHLSTLKERFDARAVVSLSAGEGPGLARPWQSSGMGARRREAALAKEQQKSLELEKYHHSILEADWLLEPEVRPILIWRIEEVAFGNKVGKTDGEEPNSLFYVNQELKTVMWEGDWTEDSLEDWASVPVPLCLSARLQQTHGPVAEV